MASDSFTGTNDVALTTHDSNWVHTTDDDYGKIYGNGVGYGAWSEGSYRYTGSNGDTSQVVVKGGYGARIGPCVRMTSGNQGYRVNFTDLSGANWTFIKLYKNGSWIAHIASGSWASASDYTLRLVASGTSSPVTLTAYVNGSSVGNTNDSSSPYTSGLSGLRLVGEADNDVTLGDDWTDGASAASGNPWYYYAQQLRSLKDKWRGLLQIPSLEEVKLYGHRGGKVNV